ncbi:hypothetical protein JTE90_001077 [Oedothorax gibbosus]|uniref:Uncharacterized protein n=1 Tax=Oedothorax gibbosus TaxID=931172 RepID=A0AAV6TMW5_9ARAC|nr:hypothetical protein JTE90_001077 [Oedothorax gibbosus]
MCWIHPFLKERIEEAIGMWLSILITEIGRNVCNKGILQFGGKVHPVFPTNKRQLAFDDDEEEEVEYPCTTHLKHMKLNEPWAGDETRGRGGEGTDVLFPPATGAGFKFLNLLMVFGKFAIKLDLGKAPSFANHRWNHLLVIRGKPFSSVGKSNDLSFQMQKRPTNLPFQYPLGFVAQAPFSPQVPSNVSMSKFQG